MTKPFIVFNRDPDTGARPGLVQGETYTTDKEVERNKYEVLESYSATYLKELEGTQTDPIPEPEPEPVEPEPVEPEPEPVEPEPVEPEPVEPEPVEPEPEPEPVEEEEPVVDQGLAKDYPGTGWYKATDTGIVYNKDVPEGETHTFEGDPIEYISVWRNEGFDEGTFEGTEEDFQKLLDWHNNLHRYATSNVTDMLYWMYLYGQDEIYDELGVSPEDINTDALNLSHYDTSNVTNMAGMFAASTFNQPLDNFDTSNVTNMDGMFSDAVMFNQDLSGWCVPKITSEPENFANDAVGWTLPKPVWGTCPRGEDGSEVPPVLEG